MGHPFSGQFVGPESDAEIVRVLWLAFDPYRSEILLMQGEGQHRAERIGADQRLRRSRSSATLASDRARKRLKETVGRVRGELASYETVLANWGYHVEDPDRCRFARSR